MTSQQYFSDLSTTHLTSTTERRQTITGQGLNRQIEAKTHLGHFSYARNVGMLSERFHVGAAVPRLYELGHIDLLVLCRFHDRVVRAVPLGVLLGGFPPLFVEENEIESEERVGDSRQRKGGRAGEGGVALCERTRRFA